MRYFIATCGLPGSGKSTWAHQRYEENIERDVPCSLICPDEVRKELYGDASIQGKPNTVFSEVYRRLNFALSSLPDGGEIIYDATNLREGYRIDILKHVAKHDNVSTQLRMFLQPIEVVVERDKQRSRTVGEEIIHKMLMGFNPPNIYKEHWDEIIFDESCATLDEGEYARKMMDFNQYNPHHSLTLYDHCLAALKNAESARDTIQEAALWHDVGKLFTQSFDDKGVAHYYGHQHVSAYYYLMLTNDASRNTFGQIIVRLYTALLISFHMKFYNKNFKFEDLYADYSFDFVADLNALHWADMYAH